ncbi:hypothetical protein [Roseomonas populi]|uniref:Uncharacterized protein n=1 Tax=Roseomonas populi TaxID=3121582 RepID=A0ABT1XCI5_9PROT|nr:hypothetical protein [Roseomonas pecuniae]MCR0985852.1 hypothetical protein [Roseomonas pecuniae]
MTMTEAPDGFALLPAPDQPAVAGRHIPSPHRGMAAGAAALLRGGRLAGIERKSMGGFNTGPLLGIAGQAITPLIAAAGGAAAVWLKGRADRRVKVKLGDFEAEARTPEELEKVMRLAAEHRQKPPEAARSRQKPPEDKG